MRIKILMVGLACLFLINCIGKKEEPIAPISTATDFKSAVRRIFGQPTGSESSGVGRIQYGEDSSVVHYKFYPLGLSKYENELGIELASNIRKLYEVGGKFNSITFFIEGLFRDKYGKTKWLPIVSFEFTKPIYNRINWANFFEGDLLKVAKNITWFRKEAVR